MKTLLLLLLLLVTACSDDDDDPPRCDVVGCDGAQPAKCTRSGTCQCPQPDGSTVTCQRPQ